MSVVKEIWLRKFASTFLPLSDVSIVLAKYIRTLSNGKVDERALTLLATSCRKCHVFELFFNRGEGHYQTHFSFEKNFKRTLKY